MRIERIKPIKLNKEGKIIGELVIVHFHGKKFWAYLSPRKPIHYFIKFKGFGIDKALLKNLMEIWHLDHVIIHYKGVKGDKFLLSNIDQWIFSDITVEYSKEYDNEGATFGVQKVLPEKEMIPLK